MRSALVGAVLVVVACAAACDGGPAGPPPVGSIVPQDAALSGRVSEQITVRVAVRDRSGTAIEGIQVTFVPVGDGGSVQPASTIAGADGTASTTWTLGSIAGVQTLEVRAGETSIRLTATAGPSDPERLLVVDGDGQNGSVAQPLPQRVRLEVQDRFGNPVPRVSVELVVTAGGGSVTPGAASTGADGRVAVEWTLGTAVGSHRMEARVAGMAPAVARATAEAGTPADVDAVSGDGQLGVVGVSLGAPLEIEVRDEFGNAVPGVSVQFAAFDAGGSVTPATALTDEVGRAASFWTLATGAGSQSAEARVDNLAPVTFSATAGPAAAARLVEVSGSDQAGPVGLALPEPLVVQVEDDFGNVVSGEPVSFLVVQGGGGVSPASSDTDAAGQTTATWTLGSAPGPNTLEARAGTLSPVTFQATARPGAPATVVKRAGDGQTGQVGELLPSQLELQVQDAFGNAVPDVTVTLAVVSGGGSVPQPTVSTDNQGIATTSWTVGTSAGPQTLEARAGSAAPTRFTATAVPGPAADLLKRSGDGQSAPVGRTLLDALVVQVMDAFANPVPGALVSFQVGEGGGSVAPSSVATDASGEASASWTVGTTIGANTLVASVTGLDPVTFTATATSSVPASVSAVQGDGQNAEVGTAASVLPSVIVRDAFGNALSGVTVTFQVTAGGGSVQGPNQVTDASGTAVVGGWTLGTTVGANAMTATVSGLTPVTFTATGTVGAAAALQVFAGDGQSALVNTAVAVDPAVIVRDGYGNPVPAVPVTFTVTGGGGSVSGGAPSTAGSGMATVASWTLGPQPGTNSLSAAAAGLTPVSFTATATAPPPPPPPTPGYDMDVRFVAPAGAAEQQAFNAAASRWMGAITSELPDVSVSLPAGACGVSHSGVNELVDDLLILVELVPIDGPGNVLGSAGPCVLRNSTSLPVVGVVRLDSADVAQMGANGLLTDVVVHEIGHVLGIGTLWTTLGLLVGAGGADPHFIGTAAISEFQSAGGSSPNPVPVENTGGSGTRDGHWREATFGNELMTGWLNSPPNPLSAVTIASLQDMGYTVNLGAADGFSLTPAAPWLRPRTRLQLLEVPLPLDPRRVDRNGRIPPTR